MVSRLSLDHLRSAAVRRQSYVGEWLPEPLVASADDDPARTAEIADSLSLAFLVLLQGLSPEQRAAFLLREELASRFFAAAEEGDLEGLEKLLAHDAGFARLHTLLGGFTPRREEVNGQAGALFFDGEGRLISHRRRRRRPDPGRERDRQPGQAAAASAGV